jgi:hypothetical protein
MAGRRRDAREGGAGEGAHVERVPIWGLGGREAHRGGRAVVVSSADEEIPVRAWTGGRWRGFLGGGGPVEFVETSIGVGSTRERRKAVGDSDSS